MSSASLYGGTYNLFHYTLPQARHRGHLRRRPGRPRRLAERDPAQHQGVLRRDHRQPEERRPRLRGRLAASPTSTACPLIVDNTLATPYLCNPLEHGADIVVHSATKFIGGHGTSIGGVIVDGGTFDFEGSGRFPGFTEPDPSYHGLVFGSCPSRCSPARYIVKVRLQLLRDLGRPSRRSTRSCSCRASRPSACAWSATCRTPRRSPSGSRRATRSTWVTYPGLASSPWHERPAALLPQGRRRHRAPSASRAASRPAAAFIEGLELFSHLANVGDVRSLVIHPASTTHSQLTEAEQVSAGVTPDLVRLSVGIESIDDILADLELGFAAAKGA